MGIIGRIAGLLGCGERAVPEWQILVEIDGVPRVVTLPGPLGVSWARSPVRSDEFERAVAEVHRRIALVRMVLRSTTPQPVELVADRGRGQASPRPRPRARLGRSPRLAGP